MLRATRVLIPAKARIHCPAVGPASRTDYARHSRFADIAGTGKAT